MVNHFKRELLISVGYLVGGILAISIGLYFITNDLESLVGQIVVQRALIATQTRSVAGLAQLKKDSIEAKAYTQGIAALLVTKDQLFDFPRWLDQVAQSRNVNLNFSADPTPVDPTDAAPGYNGFSLMVSGSLQDDMDFIRDIESRVPKFLVSLTNFDVTRDGNQYDIKTHGQVYFQ